MGGTKGGMKGGKHLTGNKHIFCINNLISEVPYIEDIKCFLSSSKKKKKYKCFGYGWDMVLNGS